MHHVPWHAASQDRFGWRTCFRLVAFCNQINSLPTHAELLVLLIVLKCCNYYTSQTELHVHEWNSIHNGNQVWPVYHGSIYRLYAVVRCDVHSNSECDVVTPHTKMWCADGGNQFTSITGVILIPNFYSGSLLLFTLFFLNCIIPHFLHLLSLTTLHTTLLVH